MAKKRSVSRTDKKRPKPSAVKTAKPRAKAGRTAWSAGRRNTHKTNGSLPESVATAPEPEPHVNVGEAMRQAIEALGEVAVDAALAPTQMLELGALYEEVARRQAAYNTRADEAKTAKKSLEGAQEMLLERVKAFTHPTPLPLFDLAQQEADTQAMLSAAEAGENPEPIPGEETPF